MKTYLIIAALSPHSKKVWGSLPGLSVYSFYVLPVPVGVLSGYIINVSMMDGCMDYHVRNDADNWAMWITDSLLELIKVIFTPWHAPDASWIHCFFFM